MRPGIVRYAVPISVLLGVLLALQIGSVPSFLVRVMLGVLIGLSFGIVAIVETYDPITRNVLSFVGAVLLFIAFLVLAFGSVAGDSEMIGIGLVSSMLYFFGVRKL